MPVKYDRWRELVQLYGPECKIVVICFLYFYFYFFGSVRKVTLKTREAHMDVSSYPFYHHLTVAIFSMEFYTGLDFGDLPSLTVLFIFFSFIRSYLEICY